MKNICLAALVFAALPMGCGDDNPGLTPDAVPPDVPPTGCTVTPSTWSAPSFTTNAADALALRAQVEALAGKTSIMTMTATVNEVADLEAVYNAGTPVLSVNVHAAFATVVGDMFPEFVAAVAAGNKDLVDDTGWNPGENGGIFVTGTGTTQSTRVFNAGAIELRQIAHKGLFAGGALYYYALKLTEGTIDDAKIDAIAAAWGTNATLDSTMRIHSANYSFAMGFHAEIAKALTDAKAYAADSKCTTERDAALRAVFRTWEQSMYARAFNYAADADSRLAAAAAGDDAAVSGALGVFGEGAGLVVGFYGLPSPTTGPLANAGRTITDPDIDAILTALRVNRTDLAASTAGTFVIDTTALNAAVTAVANRLKQVYQLTDADIEKYRTPTSG